MFNLYSAIVERFSGFALGLFVGEDGTDVTAGFNQLLLCEVSVHKSPP